MRLPDLLICEDEGEYLEYYRKEYCRKCVVTFDGIRVYFREDRFSQKRKDMIPAGGFVWCMEILL